MMAGVARPSVTAPDCSGSRTGSRRSAAGSCCRACRTRAPRSKCTSRWGKVRDGAFVQRLPAGASGLEDGPSDLGAPGGLVRGVRGAGEVVLAERAVDGEGVRGDVRTEASVGQIDPGMRAPVDDNG